MKLTKQEIDNLKLILEEYITCFKKLKEHKKEHEKIPCPRCNYAKKILEKLK